MMKIYTKKGDSGETSLYGGDRISKSATRIEAYGTVDELNSVIGLILTHSLTELSTVTLQKIQEQLFVLGADLATPDSAKERISRIDEQEILFMEDKIDEMEEELPELKNFILPGGSRSGALLHLARTVCRRAERKVVELRKQHEMEAGNTVKFLNRLSDLLFVAARFENHHNGTAEKVWNPKNVK